MKNIYYIILLFSQITNSYNIITTKSKQKYNINLNKCITSLESDIQQFPYNELEWNIYSQSIILKDPYGIKRQGLSDYKQIFSLIRLFNKIAVINVDITQRLKYIPESQKILIVWYSKWFIWGLNNSKQLNVISHFNLNDEGLINEHSIEYMYSNNDVAIIKNIAQVISNIYILKNNINY